MRKIIIASFIIILIIGALTGYIVKHDHPTNKIAVRSAKVIPKVVSSTLPVAPVNYGIGDIQIDGSLSITVNSAGIVPYAGFILPNTSIYQVDLTVANNGVAPVNESTGSGFNVLSSINTSSGYILPDQSNAAASCFGGEIDIINPGQTVSSCVPFAIPSSASVSAYYYDSLKWNF